MNKEWINFLYFSFCSFLLFSLSFWPRIRFLVLKKWKTVLAMAVSVLVPRYAIFRKETAFEMFFNFYLPNKKRNWLHTTCSATSPFRSTNPQRSIKETFRFVRFWIATCNSLLLPTTATTFSQCARLYIIKVKKAELVQYLSFSKCNFFYPILGFCIFSTYIISLLIWSTLWKLFYLCDIFVFSHEHSLWSAN